MSIQDYKVATELVSNYLDIADFVGPRPQSLIVAAEKILGVTFPQSYRRFLQDYGAGSFGSAEVYGVLHENFEESGVPDGIWLTLQLREEGDFPATLVVIYSVGDGELFCLDTGLSSDNEAPVVTFTPGGSLDQRRELIAEDFGLFFLDLVQQEIGYLKNET